MNRKVCNLESSCFESTCVGLRGAQAGRQLRSAASDQHPPGQNNWPIFIKCTLFGFCWEPGEIRPPCPDFTMKVRCSSASPPPPPPCTSSRGLQPGWCPPPHTLHTTARGVAPSLQLCSSDKSSSAILPPEVAMESRSLVASPGFWLCRLWEERGLQSPPAVGQGAEGTH